MYDGEYCMYLTEEDQIEPIFWNKNNALYLRSYDFVKCKILYLKLYYLNLSDLYFNNQMLLSLCVFIASAEKE